MKYGITSLTGEISPRLYGRYDLPVYRQGAKTFDNFIPLPFGGISKRPGLKREAAITGYTDSRLIVWSPDADHNFLLVLYNNGIAAYTINSDGTLTTKSLTGTGPAYTASQIHDVQYAQAGRRLYIVHPSVAPAYLEYSVAGAATWTTAISYTLDTGETDLFQSAGYFPRAVAVFNNRLWFAGSNQEPQKIWASKSFSYHEFVFSETLKIQQEEPRFPKVDGSDNIQYDTSTYDSDYYTADPGEPLWEDRGFYSETRPIMTHYFSVEKDYVADDSSMELELGGERAGNVLSLAVKNDLIVSTTDSEWIIPSSIVATFPVAFKMTEFGGSKLPSKLLGDAMMMIHKNRKGVRDYFYQNEQAAWQSLSISGHADHLFTDEIKGFAAKLDPEPVAYFVLDDGTALQLYYDRGQGVLGWASITDGGARTFKSVVALDEYVYFAVHQTINSVETISIERKLADFSYTEGSIVYLDGFDTVTFTDGAGTDTNFRSKTVGVVKADGTYLGSYATDASGNLTSVLDSAANYSGNAYVGYIVDSTLETLPIEFQDQPGIHKTINGALLRVINSRYVYTEVLDSNSVSQGKSEQDKQTDSSWYSGDLEISYKDGGTDPTMRILSDKPLPLTIGAIIIDITGGTS